VKSPMPLLDAPEIRESLRLQNDALAPVAPVAPAGLASSHGFEVDWSQGFDDNVLRFEAFVLAEALRKHPSTDAREKLQLSRSRFYEKVKQFGLGR